MSEKGWSGKVVHILLAFLFVITLGGGIFCLTGCENSSEVAGGGAILKAPQKKAI